MCRERYTVETLPRETVPDALQLHVTPSIRKLNFSPSSPTSQSAQPTPPNPSPREPTPCEGLERHQAEILALRAQRAELARRNQQASTTAAGLCMLARTAKEWGARMQRERDALAKEVDVLRKRLREQTPNSDLSEPVLDSVFCSGAALGGPGVTGGVEHARPCKRPRLEMPRRMQMQVPADILGPSLSRRTTPQLPLLPKYEPLSPSLSPIPSTPRL
ncbi:hypothetical protein HWV62_11497 [Athelia sp. TMB]|nr:hypothetical protein HWV62_11497 [Athelia sp. TMB]